MPYCRTCGNRLGEDDRFCQRCGTPAWNYTPPPPTKQVPSLRRDPIIIVGAVLTIILVVAAVAIAFLAAPLATWGFNSSLEDDSANIKTIDFNFESNVGQVKITPLKIDNNNIGIYVKANGSRGLMEESDSPVTLLFDNRTEGNTLIVNSKLVVQKNYLNQVNVIIDIFVDPNLTLNLNITTDAGSINIAADKQVVFQSLNLKSLAGSVDATMHNSTITGNISLSTNAGSIYLGISQCDTVGNNTINLHSNAGSVTADITQTKAMHGNLAFETQTNLGSVNVIVVVDGDVAAKITSNTSLGGINVERANNFSGNQSPLQSTNYPAASNIEINSTTNLGSVNINADYQSKSQPSINRN